MHVGDARRAGDAAAGSGGPRRDAGEYRHEADGAPTLVAAGDDVLALAQGDDGGVRVSRLGSAEPVLTVAPRTATAVRVVAAASDGELLALDLLVGDEPALVVVGLAGGPALVDQVDAEEEGHAVAVARGRVLWTDGRTTRLLDTATSQVLAMPVADPFPRVLAAGDHLAWSSLPGTAVRAGTTVVRWLA